MMGTEEQLAMANKGKEGVCRMHDSARKADSRTDVARTIGILLLLAGILFAAGLCTASPLADNQVPNILSATLIPGGVNLSESVRRNAQQQIAHLGSLSLSVPIPFSSNPIATSRGVSHRAYEKV